jgi:hypothetical protein
MLTLAEAHKDALVAEGMSPGLLEELGAKVTEFEAVSDAARTARLCASTPKSPHLINRQSPAPTGGRSDGHPGRGAPPG